MVIVLQVWGSHTGYTYCYCFYITDGDSSMYGGVTPGTPIVSILQMVIVLQVWGRHTGYTYCYYFYITDGDSSTGMGETHRVHLLLLFLYYRW